MHSYVTLRPWWGQVQVTARLIERLEAPAATERSECLVRVGIPLVCTAKHDVGPLSAVDMPHCRLYVS